MIDTAKWKPISEKPGYVKKKEQRLAYEVFSELEAELRKANLYPDDYFLIDKYFDSPTMLCPDFHDVMCYAQWGNSEGIYIEVDVVIYNEQEKKYERKNFATGKTLKDDSASYDRMQYTAGYIYKLFRGEHFSSPRYIILQTEDKPTVKQLLLRVQDEYRRYLLDNLVHRTDLLPNVADEIGIRSLIIKELPNCLLPEDKLAELVDADNALDLLTKICRHVLEADSFEINDTISSCGSFASELQSREANSCERKNNSADSLDVPPDEDAGDAKT